MKSLGDRIKEYERSYDYTIIGRLPIIIRLDGKGFSKWTKKCKFIKPFDEILSNQMINAMKETAKMIEGCIFAFTQSDEVTFVLRNDQSLESTPWFGNRIQKIASVVGSIFTAHFNRFDIKYNFPLAFFDARVFAVPSLIEVCNYLCWRQQDATKNSISSSCYYEVAKKNGKKTTKKQMHGLNQKQQQELLFKETNINWNNCPTKFKRGSGCYKIEKEVTLNNNTFIRNSWAIDENLPVFTQDQDFLRKIFGFEVGDVV